MCSKTMIFVTIMLFMITLSTAKNVFDHRFELNAENASVFLHTSTGVNSSPDFGKRESGTNCVSCKFGMVQCCAPNICRKKTLMPDECMEIKTADKHKHV